MSKLVKSIWIAILTAIAGAAMVYDMEPTQWRYLSSLTQPVPVAMPSSIKAISIEEAQSRITFDIPLPQVLPEELTLGGARAFTQTHVQFFYTATVSEAGLGIEVSTSGIEQYAYPPSISQTVQLNGISGKCIQGSWQKDRQWHEEADVTVLYWFDKALFYRMSQSGLGLACEDMIQIGESFSP